MVEGKDPCEQVLEMLGLISEFLQLPGEMQGPHLAFEVECQLPELKSIILTICHFCSLFIPTLCTSLVMPPHAFMGHMEAFIVLQIKHGLSETGHGTWCSWA